MRVSVGGGGAREGKDGSERGWAVQQGFQIRKERTQKTCVGNLNKQTGTCCALKCPHFEKRSFGSDDRHAILSRATIFIYAHVLRIARVNARFSRGKKKRLGYSRHLIPSIFTSTGAERFSKRKYETTDVCVVPIYVVAGKFTVKWGN